MEAYYKDNIEKNVKHQNAERLQQTSHKLDEFKARLLAFEGFNEPGLN